MHHLNPLDWAGGEYLLMSSITAAALMPWLIRTGLELCAKRKGWRWWIPAWRGKTVPLEQSPRHFRVPHWRLLTLAICLVPIALGYYTATRTSYEHERDLAFRNKPAIRALSPSSVSQDGHYVIINRGGCQALFPIDENGTITGPGTVHSVVSIQPDGTLSCTDQLLHPHARLVP